MIYVGDVGATIILNTRYDLTGNTAALVYLVDPAGTIVTKTPTITSPLTGIMTYTTTTESELYMDGEWTVQAVVWFGVNKPMYSNIGTFTVYTPPANPTGAII